jgi:hypothetical protein
MPSKLLRCRGIVLCWSVGFAGCASHVRYSPQRSSEDRVTSRCREVGECKQMADAYVHPTRQVTLRRAQR